MYRNNVGVTALLLTVSYKGQEFIRVGYYVYNELMEEIDIESKSLEEIISKIRRYIISEKPRVTKFNINWEDEEMKEETEEISEEKSDTFGDKKNSTKEESNASMLVEWLSITYIKYLILYLLPIITQELVHKWRGRSPNRRQFRPLFRTNLLSPYHRKSTPTNSERSSPFRIEFQSSR